MEELTDFASLLGRAAVMRLELNAVLDRFAATPSRIHPLPLIGRGVLHSIGLAGGFRVKVSPKGEADDVSEIPERQACEDLVTHANRLLDRSALRGPSDDEVGGLRALGWNPERIAQVGDRRAASEQELRFSWTKKTNGGAAG